MLAVILINHGRERSETPYLRFIHSQWLSSLHGLINIATRQHVLIKDGALRSALQANC